VTRTGSGPCVVGAVMDDPDGLPPVKVLGATECAAGTVSTAWTNVPLGGYDMTICTTVCNDLSSLDFRNSNVTLPVGTFGSWSYSSPSQLAMTMTLGPAEVSASISASGNVQTVAGTFYDTTTNPNTTTYFQEFNGQNNWVGSTTKATIPFTYTIGTANQPEAFGAEMGYYPLGNYYFFDMFIPLPTIYLKFP